LLMIPTINNKNIVNSAMMIMKGTVPLNMTYSVFAFGTF